MWIKTMSGDLVNLETGCVIYTHKCGHEEEVTVASYPCTEDLYELGSGDVIDQIWDGLKHQETSMELEENEDGE